MQTTIIKNNKEKEYTLKEILKIGKRQNELKIAKKITVTVNQQKKQDK